MSKKKAMFFKQEVVGTEGLYNWSDAGTPTPNEANTVSLSVTNGWDEFGTVSLSPVSYEFQNGGYSIELQGTAGANDYCRLYFTVEIGKTYRLTFWAKEGTTNSGQLRGAGGWVTSPPNTGFSSTWTEYTFDVEANSTQGHFNLWANRFGTIGDTAYIDNVTMEEI